MQVADHAQGHQEEQRHAPCVGVEPEQHRRCPRAQDLHACLTLGRENFLELRVEPQGAAGFHEVVEIDHHRGRAAVVAHEQARDHPVPVDARAKVLHLGVVRRHLVGELLHLERVFGAVDVLDPLGHERDHAAGLDAGDLLEGLGDALHLGEDGRRVDRAARWVDPDDGHVFAAEHLLDALAHDHPGVTRRDLSIDVDVDLEARDEEREAHRDREHERDHQLGPRDNQIDVAAQHFYPSSEARSVARCGARGKTLPVTSGEIFSAAGTSAPGS